MKLKKILRIAAIVVLALALTGTTVYFFFPGVILKIRQLSVRSDSKLTEKTLSTPSHSWPYLDGGPENAPTIVFVHGFGANKDAWAKVMGFFSKDFRVISPDLPAFGDNKFNKELEYSYANIARYLDEFLSALKLSSFHIIGVSMGGGVSGIYAALYPQKILSLTLMDTAAVIGEKNSPFIDEYLRTGVNPLAYTTVEQFDKAMAYVLGQPLDIPGHFKSYLVDRKISRMESETKIWNELNLEGPDSLGEELDKISAPTLIMWGEKDNIIDVAVAHRLKRELKNSSLEIFPGMGHAPYYVAPEKVADVYRKFLGNLTQ